MKNWKRALVLTGKRPAGIAAATVGLAVLASEYPDTFERVWEHAPDYVTRGTQIFQTLTQIAERLAQQAGHRDLKGWRVRHQYEQ
jgi:hypothetical protein